MMPRIQFSYDGGDGIGEDQLPRRPHSTLIQDTFCNPSNSNCSPVCCCCGLLPIRVAVKGVIYIAMIFSVWEVTMGSWLLIEASCCLQPGVDDVALGIRQLSKLRGAGWLLILVGLCRAFALLYLLYSVSNEDRARKLPAILCVSISILIGLILTYPFFISIPGKGIIMGDTSHLKDFKSAYALGHTIDLLFMIFYSLYVILYYIILTNYNQAHPTGNLGDVEDNNCDFHSTLVNNGSRPHHHHHHHHHHHSNSSHHRFEPIDTSVRLT